MSVTLNIPANTNCGLMVFCNSAYYQKAIVTPSGGTPITLYKTTSGASTNLMISSPNQSFSSGSTGQVTVDIQYSKDNKTWSESQLSQGSLGVSTTYMWVVASEDANDNDYNDTVVVVNTPIG